MTPPSSSDHGSDSPPPGRDDVNGSTDDPTSVADGHTTECRLPFDAQPDSHLGRSADSAVATLQRLIEEPPGRPALREPTQPDLLRLPQEGVDPAFQPTFADVTCVVLTPGYCPDIVVFSTHDACDYR